MKHRLLVAFFAVMIVSAVPLAFAAGQKEAPAGPAELEVAAVLYGHANEGTWDPAAYRGLLSVQQEVPFILHLAEGTGMQDAEKVIRNWASRGVDIVFAHSLIYLDQVITVARQFPDVHFICETVLDPAEHMDEPEHAKLAAVNTPENLTLLGDTPYEGNYLAGVVAALVSKTKKIGILQPFESPGLNRYSNCFYFGAKEAVPEIEAKIVYIGDYLAPAETRDAVRSLAQQGCDVVFSEMDDNSAILESAAQGIYCIPMYIDKSDVDPKTVLTSVVFDWSKPLQGSIEAVANGTVSSYRKQWYFRPLSLTDGSLYLGRFSPVVSEEVKRKVSAVEERLRQPGIQIELVTEAIIK